MSEAWRFVAWRENKYSRRLCSSPEQISPFYAAFTPMRACGRVIFFPVLLSFSPLLFLSARKCCSGADAFFSRMRTYADPGSFKPSAPPGDQRVLFLFSAVLIEG